MGPTLSSQQVTKPRMGGASFPLRHRLERATWNITWRLLGAWTPVPLHAWRRFLLRAFGARIAHNAKVYPSASVWYPRNLQMHEYATLGPGANCYCMAEIVLEKFSLVSQRAHLCAGTHDVDDADFSLVTKPIRIGQNAWVAAEAFVGPGVTVNKDAVLGARAVTMKDLEAGKIYAGNPARPLRARTIHE
ncbi:MULTISPECIES: putative colanic acid biosynthesis acetyltransferase [Bradyrhizobium]|uniref:putative colanic acid biosynthesis acetyltransferase n=1 Tax=Bradyrhizobium TaxID=374 RepID=UPI001BA55714|nr:MULTISPECIES: putative colanic acid biosynthesis acetyltransferase [Bradyrhizobium]MBR1364810.1 putative colanic acid biosynthesis acetyltransferase [Bradyrhizobium ottawaense]MDA9448625.1 acetyltransferase [Bradyrhizobium sp. CCBAU 21360]